MTLLPLVLSYMTARPGVGGLIVVNVYLLNEPMTHDKQTREAT